MGNEINMIHFFLLTLMTSTISACGNSIFVRGKDLGVVVIIILMCASNSCAASVNTCAKGVITPRDPFFLVGQDLIITCTTNRTGTIYFTRGLKNDKENLDYYTHVMNATSSQLHIPNLTAEHAASHFKSVNYKCYVKKPDGSTLCITNQYVQIDYPPKEPQDFSCVVNNKETMKCTWDLGKYFHPEHVRVSTESLRTYAYYTESLSDAESKPCPEPTNMSCFWNKEEYMDPPYYYVSVTINNTQATKIQPKTFNWTVVTEDVTKPAPVTELKVTASAKNRCYNVTFMPELATYRYVTYLRLTAECMDPMEQIMQDPKELSDSQYLRWTEFCGIPPSTKFKVSAETKFLSLMNKSKPVGLCSNPATVYYETRDGVPGNNPLAIFEDRGKMGQDSHRIVVYIQPLSKCEMHAKKVWYKLSVPWKSVNETIDHPNIKLKLDYVSSKYDVLRFWTLKVTAASNEGERMDSTVLKVYQKQARPAVNRELVVQYVPENTSYIVYLLGNQTDPRFINLTYTLYWCEGDNKDCNRKVDEGNTSAPGQGIFKAQSLSSSEWSLVLNKSEDLWFGLSVKGVNRNTREEITSGIDWTKCIYKHNSEPDVVFDVSMTHPQPPKAFSIQWKPPNCNPFRYGYITHYEVKYCEVLGSASRGCNGSVIETVRVSNKETRYTKKGLMVGARYEIWVMSISIGNYTSSEDVEHLRHRVSDNTDMETWTWIAVILGLVVVIVMIIVCVIWHYIKKTNAESRARSGVTAPEVQGGKRHHHTIEDPGDSSTPLIGFSTGQTDSGTEMSDSSFHNSQSSNNGSLDSAIGGGPAGIEATEGNKLVWENLTTDNRHRAEVCLLDPSHESADEDNIEDLESYIRVTDTQLPISSQNYSSLYSIDKALEAVSSHNSSFSVSQGDGNYKKAGIESETSSNDLESEFSESDFSGLDFGEHSAIASGYQQPLYIGNLGDNGFAADDDDEEEEEEEEDISDPQWKNKLLDDLLSHNSEICTSAEMSVSSRSSTDCQDSSVLSNRTLDYNLVQHCKDVCVDCSASVCTCTCRFNNRTSVSSTISDHYQDSELQYNSGQYDSAMSLMLVMEDSDTPIGYQLPSALNLGTGSETGNKMVHTPGIEENGTIDVCDIPVQGSSLSNGGSSEHGIGSYTVVGNKSGVSENNLLEKDGKIPACDNAIPTKGRKQTMQGNSTNKSEISIPDHVVLQTQH